MDFDRIIIMGMRSDPIKLITFYIIERAPFTLVYSTKTVGKNRRLFLLNN